MEGTETWFLFHAAPEDKDDLQGFIAGQVSSHFAHQVFTSISSHGWLVQQQTYLLSSRTRTLHLASSTLQWEDGVDVCVQRGSGLPLM